METLVDLPEIEYLDGAAYPKVSPKRKHAVVQRIISNVIAECAGDRGDVGTEWRFRIGGSDASGTEFLPDVAYVSYERLDALPEHDQDEPPFAPDVAVEVRSPSDRPGLRAAKIARYLAAGSVLVIEVDPARHTLDAHSSNGVAHFADGDAFESDLLPWLRFDLAPLFARLERGSRRNS